MLPALFYPAQTIRRVLVLGVGGGAVIHQIHRYIQPDVIDAVELNDVHIFLAKKFFGISPSFVNLHHANAVDWVHSYNGEPYDMIIDDLYGELIGEPVRAVQANKAWVGRLRQLLSDSGLLVMNFTDRKEFRACACISESSISRHFKTRFQLTLAQYHNVVGAFLQSSSSSEYLRGRISEIELLNTARKANKLQFRLQKIRAST